MEFTVTEVGRLDALIAAQDSGVSRSKIQKVIKEGCVSVNGVVTKKSAQQLQEGDVVSVAESDSMKSVSTQITPVDQHLDVLFEDDACLVIDKPAGIAVHPGHAMHASEQTLLSGVAHLFAERTVPFSADSVLVHRLDKPTTGCIIIAKNDAAFAALQKQFEDRTTDKTYVAIVAGVPEHDEATIDSPIGRNLTDRTKMSVVKTSVSRDAKTVYRVVDSADDIALLECDLHTGRTHQIRVHLSSIGHPILGDDTYGSTASKKASDAYAVSGLCLHAWRIAFDSPADGKRHIVHAPISAVISAVSSEAGLGLPSD